MPPRHDPRDCAERPKGAILLQLKASLWAPRARACSGCCLSYRIFRETAEQPPAEIDLGFPTEAEEGAGPGWSVTPAARAAATPLGTRRLDTRAVVPGRRTLAHVTVGPDTRSLMRQGEPSLIQPRRAGIRLGQNFCSGLTGLESIHYQNLSGQCRPTGPVPPISTSNRCTSPRGRASATARS